MTWTTQNGLDGIMKNWDVTACQIVLLAVGAFYLYQAASSFMGYYTGMWYWGQGFVFTMSIGIILVGMALALQQIRSYRAKKVAEVKIVS